MLIVIGAFPGAVPMMTSFNLRADFSLSTYLVALRGEIRRCPAVNRSDAGLDIPSCMG